MNFVRQAIAQPVTVAVGIILIVMVGVLALRRIPIQLTPNVESTIITVTTFWEGASPQEVEQNVGGRAERRRQAGGAPSGPGQPAPDHQHFGPEPWTHPSRVLHGHRQG
jgi:hypothetical protein